MPKTTQDDGGGEGGEELAPHPPLGSPGSSAGRQSPGLARACHLRGAGAGIADRQATLPPGRRTARGVAAPAGPPQRDAEPAPRSAGASAGRVLGARRYRGDRRSPTRPAAGLGGETGSGERRGPRARKGPWGGSAAARRGWAGLTLKSLPLRSTPRTNGSTPVASMAAPLCWAPGGSRGGPESRGLG